MPNPVLGALSPKLYAGYTVLDAVVLPILQDAQWFRGSSCVCTDWQDVQQRPRVRQSGPLLQAAHHVQFRQRWSAWRERRQLSTDVHSRGI